MGLVHCFKNLITKERGTSRKAMGGQEFNPTLNCIASQRPARSVGDPVSNSREWASMGLTAQQVKVFAAEPDDLMTPWTHVERGSSFQQVVLRLLHVRGSVRGKDAKPIHIL